jgi:FixJ family two-component response regulator
MADRCGLSRTYGRRGNPVGPAFASEGVLVTQRRPSKQIDALPETPIVLVVDDDASVREALSSLFRSVGLDPKLFASTAELLQHELPDAPCCLVLDIRLPGVSGLDFQTQLAKASIHVPIIMMTGHGDIPMSVRAMKAGAVDFLTKPFRDQDMLDAVAQAIERDRKRRDREKSLAELRGLFESLTTREREIMALVTAGLMNKQVAGQLGLSEITVKIHRGHVMRKMGVRSLADLVRAAEVLELRQAEKSAAQPSV